MRAALAWARGSGCSTLALIWSRTRRRCSSLIARTPTPRLVRHYEVEYAIPYARASEALGLLDETLARHPVKTMFPVEVRFTGADDIPLSMSQGRDVVYIAVHAYRREDYRALFDLCEDRWYGWTDAPTGKLHSLQSGELRRRYPCWDEFQAARAALDPAGVFENGYLRRVLGPRPAPAPAPT